MSRILRDIRDKTKHQEYNNVLAFILYLIYGSPKTWLLDLRVSQMTIFCFELRAIIGVTSQLQNAASSAQQHLLNICLVDTPQH